RSHFLEGRGTGHLVLVALLFAAMLGVGVLAERGFQRAVRSIRHSFDDGTGTGLVAEATRCVFRLVFDLLDLVAFTAGALIFFFGLSRGPAPGRRLALPSRAAVLLVGVAAVVPPLLPPPEPPARRLLSFGDAAARRLHAAVVVLAALYAFGI